VDFLVYLLVVLVFMNRYFLGVSLTKLKGKRFDPVRDDYEPTVATVTPLFNEGKQIYKTIQNLLAIDYPKDKFQIIVVDDCSTDDSLEWALKAAEGHPNVKVMRNPVNTGKRKAINYAVRSVDAEIIVSVDSDVNVEPNAVRELVRRFVRPEIAAVGGRVHVANPNDNWLTRMQVIKFYFAQEWIKDVERSFHSVMCLSGCLTAYRRDVLMELEPILENRNVLGIPIKYGEDRFLTRQIIKAGYQTFMTTAAQCSTVSPNTLAKYFSQQLRWRRSNLIDFFGGLTHIWRQPPLVALNYLALYSLMLAYPLLIVQKVVNEMFWDLAVLHMAVLGAMGVVYTVGNWNVPKTKKVGLVDLMSLAVLLPVSYFLLTPLGIFTLDSGSWETRGSPAPAPGGAAETPGTPHEPAPKSGRAGPRTGETEPMALHASAPGQERWKEPAHVRG